MSTTQKKCLDILDVYVSLFILKLKLKWGDISKEPFALKSFLQIIDHF